jgi:hypothetical protein
MQQIAFGYRGLGLLFDVNNNRFLSILFIAMAMAAVVWAGTEYVHAFIANDQVFSAPTSI